MISDLAISFFAIPLSENKTVLPKKDQILPGTYRLSSEVAHKNDEELKRSV